MPSVPSHRLSVIDLVDQLKRAERGGASVRVFHRPGASAVYGDWPTGPHDLDARILAALRKRGIERPYSHQADAIARILAGRNTVVVTPTASGKTICYNVPVLSAILRDPNARAIYVFPTKALAQDQLAELHGLVEEIGADIKTFTYDGDTPANARRVVRLAGNIVVTNPDMLHTGILPHHTKWHRLFSQLRYVVIDEMHSYRGLFGSHVANVIRRLKRICAYYGSRPCFILCSATIGNPRELAQRLIEDDIEVVDYSGAPTSDKHVVFFNPPVVNRQLGIRAGSLLTARGIAAQLVENDIPTIVFARSRLAVELMLTYLREDARRALKPVESVRGYRGGYLPNERREIERGLRDGTVRTVVSTNALELGIDIGGLDACVIVGYPGTIASTWQQAGRAGRRSGSSLAVIVASSAPLDQYIAHHPEYLLHRSPENGLLNPDNLYVLASHVKCGAFELPFEDGARLGDQPIGDLLGYFGERRLLHHSGQRWYWSADAFPAEEISLRSASTDNIVIVVQTEPAKPVVIGEMDRLGASTMLHDEAIYIHEGQQHEVLRLDWDEHKAYVRRVDVDYYTDAELAVNLEVIDQFADAPLGLLQRAWGEAALTAMATVYKKIKLHTHENVGFGRIRLPEDNLHTSAYWISLPLEVVERFEAPELQEALLGLGHIIANVAPLRLMCDPRDLGVHTQVRAPHTGLPTVYVYDGVPGGIGFAERLFETSDQLIASARELLTECVCESGCPSCVGVTMDPTLDGKSLTLRLLDRAREAEGSSRG